jgi:hypothetical protein
MSVPNDKDDNEMIPGTVYRSGFCLTAEENPEGKETSKEINVLEMVIWRCLWRLKTELNVRCADTLWF